MTSLLIGLRHLKTTLGGIGSILAGLGLLAPVLVGLSEGKPIDFDQVKTQLAAAVGLISTGISLLFAKDADKSNAPSPTAKPQATPRGFASLALVLVLAVAALLALPARAQEVPRWSLQLGKLTVTPSVSVTPLVISLTEILDKDFELSAGPNVGAGVDLTAPNGWGGAVHLTQRSTTDGPRALVTAFAIVPALEAYHLRAGVAYQIGGGAAPWTDGVMLCISGASNFGLAGD